MRATPFLLAFAVRLLAADGAGLLVSTEWLASRLAQPDLVVLHAGTAADFAQGHIPGARLVELTDISITGDDGLLVELPPLERLRETFRRLGVSESSRVVVYAGEGPLPIATRVFFTLDYLGLGDRTALLDGGLAAWRAEGRPLSREAAPATPPGNFTPRPSAARLVDADRLRLPEAHRDFTVLDARAPEFYSGAKVRPPLRAGHIPGARNVPVAALLDEQGKFKGRAELAAILEAAGVRRGVPVVAYCHIGMQASVLYFVARYLGYDARLYDGSFEDWSRRAELPVAATVSAAGP